MSGLEELRYLLHFAKMIRLKKQPPVRMSNQSKPVSTQRPKRKQSKATVDAQTFKRKFSIPLEFLEEREWRIVYHPTCKHFEKGPLSGVPDYFMPYIPGEDLFTLVLPDNKVVSKVLQQDWFTERLFTPWKHYRELKGRRVPPVTLLSHSDIGTF